jgi:hypothetical protein
MQTFLPSGNAIFAAQELDNKRLNKQILEGYQILNVLSGNSPTGAWRNHPAVLMWKGHEGALLDYVREMISEAKYRGIKTENNEANINRIASKDWNTEKPSWMKDKKVLGRIVATHRANLYRKDPVFYAKYAVAVNHELNKPCCPTCQYYWPTHPLKKDK